MIEIEYTVVFHTRSGWEESYAYSREEDAREHFDLFKDGEDADLYSYIELISYDYTETEETLLDCINFAGYPDMIEL